MFPKVCFPGLLVVRGVMMPSSVQSSEEVPSKGSLGEFEVSWTLQILAGRLWTNPQERGAKAWFADWAFALVTLGDSW